MFILAPLCEKGDAEGSVEAKPGRLRGRKKGRPARRLDISQDKAIHWPSEPMVSSPRCQTRSEGTWDCSESVLGFWVWRAFG